MHTVKPETSFVFVPHSQSSYHFAVPILQDLNLKGSVDHGDEIWDGKPICSSMCIAHFLGFQE